MATHPIIVTLLNKRIRRQPVHKHMHEKFPIGFEPAAQAAKQHRPIAHVLEHFHRNDAVVAGAGIEIVHVGSDDAHIVEIAARGFGFDVSALSAGIRYRGNAAGGVVLGHP